MRLAGTLAAAGFGALWGSFLNVCIVRVPAGLSVVRPPSHCFACGKQVKARDNIPILSYFLLHGRCRHCGAKFSSRYALVEALMAVFSALIFWNFVVGLPGEPVGLHAARFATNFAFTAVLVVLSFIDLNTKRLPDVITLPSIAVFFLAGFALPDVIWWERAIGAAAGYLLVRLVADGYYYLTGREGLGLGDGKLLAMMGALLGWRAIPAIVFLSSVVGILVSVPVLLARRRHTPPAPEPESRESRAESAGLAGREASREGMETLPGLPSTTDQTVPLRQVEVPFGPFLAASALLYLFVGNAAWALIIRWISGD
jgi:leader peptidase (prepilin peptidase) / N-methyltransferase